MARGISERIREKPSHRLLDLKRGRVGWGHENSFFMPMKELLEPSEKADAYLPFIHDNSEGLNEEAKPICRRFSIIMGRMKKVGIGCKLAWSAFPRIAPTKKKSRPTLKLLSRTFPIRSLT